jgi:hypothetical protein
LRDTLQRSYVWNFCKKRIALPALSTPPLDFAHAYALPNDFLRLIDVRSGFQWSIEQGKILTDADAPLSIVYSARVEDTTKFDPLFTESLASYMAFELAEVFLQSRTKNETLFQLYQSVLAKAVATDAREQHPMQIDESDWVTSRWSW